tara:strand:+ start:20 stop:1063 length:1044 start_codon:yes stop_codon:yes gene_type:complete
MRKITKLFLAIAASALLVLPTYAGELAVTGGAKVTYTTSGAVGSEGKSIGVANELDFSASGELDNGYTWSYQVQLDGATTANDDTKLTIGTDMGTIGFYISEGGMKNNLAHGVGAMGVGMDYSSTSTFETGYNVNGYANVQYHTPAGMLPFDAIVKLGYVPDMNDSDMISGEGANAAIATQATGRALEQINFSAVPVEGLTVKGDAARTASEQGGTNTEQGVSANLGAQYTSGAFSVGYTEGGYQPGVASGEVTYYEGKYYGIQYDVSEALSVSYNVDKSEKNVRTAVAVGSTAGTKTVTEMEQKSYMLAYTTGGVTIGLTQYKVSDADYTSGKEETNNIASLAISF